MNISLVSSDKLEREKNNLREAITCRHCKSEHLAAVWWHCTAGVHRPASRLFRTYTVCRDVEAAAAVILFLSSGERAANYRTLPRRPRFTMARDRKSVVEGKSASVRVDLGGRRFIKKKTKIALIVTSQLK